MIFTKFQELQGGNGSHIEIEHMWSETSPSYLNQCRHSGWGCSNRQRWLLRQALLCL